MVRKKVKEEAPGTASNTAPYAAPQTRGAARKAASNTASSTAPKARGAVNKAASNTAPKTPPETHGAASKAASNAAPDAAPYTAPGAPGAPNEATPSEPRGRLTDDSPPATKRPRRASVQRPNLNMESHQAAPKGPDVAAAMASDPEDIAEIDPVSNCDITADVDMANNHKDAAEIDPISNRDDAAEIDMSMNHDDTAEKDPASNRNDTVEIEMANNHKETSEIVSVSDDKETAGIDIEMDLVSSHNDIPEVDMVEKSVPPTTDDQKQPSDASIPDDILHGNILIRWPSTKPEEVDSSAFTTAEYDRLEEVTPNPADMSTTRIIFQIDELDEEIDRFVDACQFIPWDELADDAQHRLEALGSNIKSSIKNDIECGYLDFKGFALKSLTWNILIDNLFSSDCTEKWCGKAWEGFGTMLAHFRGTDRVDPNTKRIRAERANLFNM